VYKRQAIYMQVPLKLEIDVFKSVAA
jgi:hypothetical protein